MAVYLVADPSGQKHKIQGPDGASPEEVIAQAQKVIPYKPTAGVGGMTQPPPQPPQGGMPGQPPQQPFNGADPQKLISAYMRYDPQGAQALVGQMIKQRFGSSQMSQLDQMKMQLDQAKIDALRRGPQAKPTNPLDDELKRARIRALEKLMNRNSQPKPVNPVPAAALDVRTQIANNQQAPLYKKLGFSGGLKPVVDPLKGKSVPASAVSDMSDEELLKLANEDDSGQ